MPVGVPLGAGLGDAEGEGEPLGAGLGEGAPETAGIVTLTYFEASIAVFFAEGALPARLTSITTPGSLK